MKRWRVRWHRHKIAGRAINWFWGNHTSPNGTYGWRWFRRDKHVRPANWTANFGPLYVSIWGSKKKKTADYD